MPLSWNEIRDRATRFARDWKDADYERGEAQNFWREFFAVFGQDNQRVYSFERRVEKLGGGQGYIDCFWPGTLIAEHKSRGKNLDKAFLQALDYMDGLKPRERPRYVIVSDFEFIRLHDLETGEEHALPTAQLPKYIRRFGFIAGYQVQELKAEDPVNLKAAERMGKLHDQLKAAGYDGHPLELMLVRMLFLLFADDTGIFQPAQAFAQWIDERTDADGSDLGAKLAEAFQVLNTPYDKRLKTRDEMLAAFPYINGRLFEEFLPIAAFDSAMREALLDACALDWSQISPAIFGGLFQSIMDATARRNLGAHYTSERNILKLIKPLFLDDLWAEFDALKQNKKRLLEFHKKLRTLTFFDPACGCGNFLVVAYRELRLLELEVMRAARTSGQLELDVHHMIQLDVDQFYGIEIEEFPAQIAQVALWLTDHQMNLQVSAEFGMYFARIPLTATPHIVNGNALRLDWDEVLPAARCSFVMGNPPFIGPKYMSDAQREDVRAVFGDIKNAGLLDFVSAWYVLAARYLAQAPVASKAAFVSTNSICQGEQVGVLWLQILQAGFRLHFAHRTFSWRNEARGMAAVHCVIVGFGRGEPAQRTIYDYEDIRGEPHALSVSNINPYLVDAPDVALSNRSKPICDVPDIGIGNKPIDGGHYLFTPEEKAAFLRQEPQARPWFRRWLGSREFINGIERWCLWLGDCPPQTLRAMPQALARVEAVRQFRLASKSAPTRKIATTPTRFHVENFPTTTYLILPEVSSERRPYIPFGFIEPETMASNLVKIAANATLEHFGVLSSQMHMAWVRAVCGRLKSDFRYSAGIVYNNYPWPSNASDQHKSKIGTTAQAVLDARATFPESSLADLYDPLTMPPALHKAHQALDRAVDAAYVPSGGAKSYASDAQRVAFLFGLYQQLTSLLPVARSGRKAAKTPGATA